MNIYVMFIVLPALIAGSSYGQEIDQERMERDLEVAKNILTTLTRDNRSNHVIHYGVSRFSGSYVKGYGVIFGDTGDGTSFILDRGSPKILLDRNGGLAKGLRENEGVVTIDLNDNASRLDSLAQNNDKLWLEKMEIFLLDYADLVGQLVPTDKIMINRGYLGTGLEWTRAISISSGTNEDRPGTSIEISKKDLISFKEGKISRAEAAKRIKTRSNSATGPAEQDIKLLASIFERLYKSDLSDTYLIAGQVYHHRVREFGVIYTMRGYATTGDDIEFYRRRSRDRRGGESPVDNTKYEQLYPSFMATLKENIVRYGRTLNSLSEEEILLFKVRISRCETCEIPQALELSIKAADLKAHNAGKLSEAAAVAKIAVKEISKR